MATLVAAAACFVWLGMVLAISFLETPLKFRAPGVTLPIGLGIGRLVFRALNAAECVLAVIVLVGALAGGAPVAAAATAAALLAVQIVVIRPSLSRRTNRVLAGEKVPRSHAHHAYVATEAAKVLALLAAGILLLAA